MKRFRVLRLVWLWLFLVSLVSCSSYKLQDGKAVSKPRQESSNESGSLEEVIVSGVRSGASPRPRHSSRGQTVEKEAPVVSLEQELIRRLNDDWGAQQSYQIFKRYGVNPTVLTESNAVSTFAMDVDSASYDLALQMLRQGDMPDPAGIRVEEFVNALSYREATSDDQFALSAEAAPSPYRAGYHILHLGVQTRSIADSERLPANIVLVADVSGSMASDAKLALLKSAFLTLVSQLDRDDRIALVSYSDRAEIVLPPTAGNYRRKIVAAIRSLKTQGSTNAEAGIRLGYQVAAQMYGPGMINRVILTSDGMANVGASAPEALLQSIAQYKDKGLFLTTVGVGVGMYNDWLLEQLANQGNGHYLHFSNTEEIQTAFVDRLTRQLQVVAKNAKIQVAFNPQRVSHYRLLGYENRALAQQDFLAADKDGGELGAGHRVTALYEIKLLENNAITELGQLRIAYQKPDGKQVHAIEKSLPQAIVKDQFKLAAADTQLSASVAAFAEKLRQSYWSKYYDYDEILRQLSGLPGSYLRDQQVEGLRQALVQAKKYDSRNPAADNGQRLSDLNLDQVPLLQ